MIERKSGDFFAAITDIRARQLAFLDYTATFYNANNRATVGPRCVYRATPNSPGCAIGQFMSPDLAAKCQGTITDLFNDKEHLHQLPSWMVEMGRGFLVVIQDLHDEESLWNDAGLTDYGKSRYNKIVERFALAA